MRRTAALTIRLLNGAVSLAAGLLILLLLCYGSYALWDTEMVRQRAFVPDEILAFKPVVEGKETDFAYSELLKVNPDVRGWITVPDTHIDHPILQGETDLEYLNKDVYGAYSVSGSIFLDSENRGDFSDGYTLIYGHHMAGGGMFGDVSRFLDPAYFESHPSGTLCSLDTVYEIEFFACVVTDAFDSVLYTPERFREGIEPELLERIRMKQVQERTLNLTNRDRIVGLSTCADTVTHGRIILFGRLK